MRILLSDDHDLFLEMAESFLSQQAGFKVDTCTSLDAACQIMEKNEPYDLILLDYSMPGMNDLNGLAKAKSVAKGCPIAILSGTAIKSVAQASIDAGAIGFLPKTMAANSMVNAIRFMAMGETYIPLDFINAAEEEPDNALNKLLSDREMEVLKELCKGKSNKEIALKLELKETTIKLYVTTLCRKIGANNRTHAAMIGKEAGIV